MLLWYVVKPVMKFLLTGTGICAPLNLRGLSMSQVEYGR